MVTRDLPIETVCCCYEEGCVPRRASSRRWRGTDLRPLFPHFEPILLVLGSRLRLEFAAWPYSVPAPLPHLRRRCARDRSRQLAPRCLSGRAKDSGLSEHLVDRAEAIQDS